MIVLTAAIIISTATAGRIVYNIPFVVAHKTKYLRVVGYRHQLGTYLQPKNVEQFLKIKTKTFLCLYIGCRNEYTMDILNDCYF